MKSSSATLPEGFESLAPFVDFWAADTAAARAHCRDISDEAQRTAFYNAAISSLPQALATLDAKRLDELDERERRLMLLVLSFAHVALAVELQRDGEHIHAANRRHMTITKAPADEPVAVRS